LELIKTSLINSLAVGIRVLTAIGLNKILAMHVGPTGFALIGQLQNFIAMITNLSSGAMNKGVIKYTAEYYDDNSMQVSFWRTAGTIGAIGSISIGLILAITRVPLSVWLLKDKEYASIFIWLGIALFMFMLNALLLAIINGNKEIRLYVLVNICSSLISLIFTGGLVLYFGLYGAFIAMAINQSIILLVTLSFCWNRPWFSIKNIFGTIELRPLKYLSKFALIAIVSAILGPIAQIIIRNQLGSNFGWDAAGHWQALNRISKLYLMLVTTPLAVYYLPRLSEIRNRKELHKEITSGYKIILPIVIFGAILIYVLRDWMVVTLFSVEFEKMTKLFLWQLLGDISRIGSWLLAYVMLSKAMVKLTVITEIIFSVSWVLFVMLFTSLYGVIGAQIGYFLNYVIYWLTVFILLKNNKTI
jgi:polysaccharide transporter, PST family